MYVGGTSYGGATSGFDFCVIAYDTNGVPLWPLSGGGTGYAYHNGAVRTTSSADEGARRFDLEPSSAQEVHVSMAVREDPSAENRVIAMTGFLTDGQNPIGSPWRTVVFQPGSAPPFTPVLMLGWPVDLAGTGDHTNIPYAVAIHTDNSVYVTGITSAGLGQQAFTTLRYKPTGNQNAQAHYWIHHWQPTPKPNCGKDLVLDRQGNVYATGFVQPGESNVDYGTIALRKDANVSGEPQVIWMQTHDRDEKDEGASIDLTYEVENGSLVPYAFVTGRSGNSVIGDILTLRYRGDDGTLQPGWPQVYATASDEKGIDVLGAGYGNAYVIGRSNNDLIVLGYRRDGTSRFSPQLYNNGGFDEGRMGAMVGAGALVGAGASAGNLLDFVTQRFTQTALPTFASNYTVHYGAWVSGGLAQLTTSDDQYLVLSDSPDSETEITIQVEFTGTTTVTNPTEIALHHEGKSNISFRQDIEVYDWLSSSWQKVDTRRTTFGDSRLTIVLKDDPSRYLNAGLFKVRFSYLAPAADDEFWRVWFDMLSWDVLGG